MADKNAPQTIGVINPYAMAEVLMKRRVRWDRISSPQALLEKTLGVPYEKLFDPKYDSPLYQGLSLDAKTKSMSRAAAPAKAKGAAEALIQVGANPVWVDPGDFFEEGAELTDPVQGALGDCYFIAALSSIAWARPYVIAHRNRVTAEGQEDFVDMIEFYKQGKPTKVEVTEKLPLQPPGNTYIYARSSETGEIWPAVYEKAYAKWRTNSSSDTPDYAPLAGGDPVGAMAQLTGLTPVYRSTAGATAHTVWQTIRGNSISYKTFNPMTAWTHSTAPSPDVNYNNAHLAANHAYSVLGWAYANSAEYVVLRNPWGTYEAVLNVMGGTWVAWDQPYYGGKGYWRQIQMATVDGIFALRSDTFQKYFAGYGWIKTPEAP